MMKRTYSLVLFIFTAMCLSACGEQSSQEDPLAGDRVVNTGSYVVLDESLAQLKHDFNANKGKIRLLFIVGDTCGICLRGVADLNDAFVARAQNDERLLTQVVHVPTLGAEEKHIPAAIPLMDGPRVLHYWDGVGKSGVHFGETLESRGVYAWDVWLAYGPDTQWLETVPPKPVFWMHQLSSFDRNLHLDADLFAEKTLVLMNNIEAGDWAELKEKEATLLADGTVIPTVSQPRGVAIQSHLMGKGGFHNIKLLETITKTGKITWERESTTLVVKQHFSDGLSRVYGGGSNPLIKEIEGVVEDSWQMHSPLFRWKYRGNEVHMDGMLKLGISLAWKLVVKQTNGTWQALFVDSHSGDIVLTRHLDENGNLMFSTRAGDFREVGDFRYPFSLEYLNPDGSVIATENYTDIGVTKMAADTDTPSSASR